MNDINLREVFGITTDIPKYTYVDRQKLDEKFEYYLGSQKHIVVYGASKQGKSSLRKKKIDPSLTLVVQCLPSMETVEDVWSTALQTAGVDIHTRSEVTKSTEFDINGEGEAKGKIPLLGEVGGKLGGGLKFDKSKIDESVSIQTNSLLSRLANFLRSHNKRLIIEDFHYLPDSVRIDIAFGLKALYEEKAYVVIIGIWSEQNLITYYNGDLTGRIEEISLTWSHDELLTVLERGESTLNIKFEDKLKNELVNSAFSNIGLLQRLAEKICVQAEVYGYQPEPKIITDIKFLEMARGQLITDIGQRYTRIAEAFRDGMRSDAALSLYARIYNELIRASNSELITGISYSVLLSRIQSHAGLKTIRQSDLTSALDKIERLQAKKNITPLLVSYSKSLRKLFLNDREFMFYREYRGTDSSDLLINTEDPSS